MIRRVILGIGLVFVVLLCLPALPPMARELVRRLPFGWTGFLRRTMPEVTLNWHGIGMVVLSSMVLLVGMHSLCGWLHRAALAPTADLPPRWPWRWTAALFAAFWILFALVMGASGLGRQLVWVSQFKEPLYVERLSGWAEIKMADGALSMALVENPTDVALAHAAFRRGEYDRVGPKPTLWEQHHVLLFTNANGSFIGYVLIPRSPAARESIGFYASGDGVRMDSQSMTNLPAVIARLEQLARSKGD